MRRHRPTSADSEPGLAPAPGSKGAGVASPPPGPARREFICGAVFAGSVVAIAWPVFAGGAEAADWSDGTAWSDGRGWKS